jgi:hypothetical protein
MGCKTLIGCCPQSRFHDSGVETPLASGMFTFQPIGYVRSAFAETSEIPKGPGTRHQAEGILEINAEFADGLLDIEGSRT